MNIRKKASESDGADKTLNYSLLEAVKHGFFLRFCCYTWSSCGAVHRRTPSGPATKPIPGDKGAEQVRDDDE